MVASLDTIKTIKNDLKRHLWKCLFWWVMFFGTILSGAILFFYIEGCHPQERDARSFTEREARYLEICDVVLAETSNNTATITPTAINSNSSTLNKVQRICQQELLQSETKFTECVSDWTKDFSILAPWLDYAITIGYTIGKSFE